MPHVLPSAVHRVDIPSGDFKVYCHAARKLARIMGASAPDAIALILHELKLRTTRGIVENYLYAIDWFAAVPAKPAPPRPAVTAAGRLIVRRRPPRRNETVVRHPDPSRN
jgi:hypothetical protein